MPCLKWQFGAAGRVGTSVERATAINLVELGQACRLQPVWLLAETWMYDGNGMRFIMSCR